MLTVIQKDHGLTNGDYVKWDDGKWLRCKSFGEVQAMVWSVDGDQYTLCVPGEITEAMSYQYKRGLDVGAAYFISENR